MALQTTHGWRHACSRRGTVCLSECASQTVQLANRSCVVGGPIGPFASPLEAECKLTATRPPLALWCRSPLTRCQCPCVALLWDIVDSRVSTTRSGLSDPLAPPPPSRSGLPFCARAAPLRLAVSRLGERLLLLGRRVVCPSFRHSLRVALFPLARFPLALFLSPHPDLPWRWARGRRRHGASTRLP